MPLVMEISADGRAWRPVAVLNPGDPDGSVSNRQADRRDVILFRCEHHRSVVYRSTGGTDYESGAQRVVSTLGVEELASLTAGESFELDVTMDSGLSGRVRWTHHNRGLRVIAGGSLVP